MHFRPARVAASAAVLLALLHFGCTSGSSTTAGLSPARCASVESKFCLVSCNLGCSSSECSVSQIAQNQPITLTFSQPIDVSSVNSATVSLRTQSGEPPIGDLLVNGDTITFQPKIEIQGGTTFFGFRANETYVLTLPSGAGGSALRGVSGGALASQVSCQLIVSRGIIDLDNQPPQPTLKAPTTTTGVSRGVTIVVEFSELIDVAPFVGSGEGSPVEFGVSRTVASANGAVCSDLQQAVPLPGVPRVTLDPVRNVSSVSFRPSVQLPGETCVEVRVTNRVRDLSGRAATPVTYKFVVEPAPPEELAAVEEFDSDGRLDRAASSTVWANGTALPGELGGSGKHGDFNPNNGVEIGGGIRVWDLDTQGGIVIPASQTLDGQRYAVTNGEFEFTTFRVPAGTTVRFVGSKFPKIRVRGEVLIQGTVDLSGAAMAQVGNAQIPPTGQPGGAPGAGGGRGGNGANASDGVARFDGSPGQDVQLLPNHIHELRARETGGRGGLQFPANNAGITHNYSTSSSQVPGGAGGGGFFADGTAGVATRSPSTPPELGPGAAGGRAFDLFPLPTTLGAETSLRHFLVGGAGGGGGGSHIYGHRFGQPNLWKVGMGGSGGGGGIGIRAGGRIEITSTGSINVRGGDSFTPYLHSLQGPPGPGGGGSGGSIVLQSTSSILATGLLDLRGGLGAWVQPGASQPLFIESRGGNGSPGFLRAEVPASASVTLQNVQPRVEPTMTGALTDSDLSSGFLTKWYATGQIFAPTFLRYEIEAEVNGVPRLFSDDERTGGTFAGIGSGQAIEVIFQAGDVDPREGTLVGAPTPWKSRVGGPNGLTGPNLDGFRFTLIFNRRLPTDTIVVRKVSVFYQV